MKKEYNKLKALLPKSWREATKRLCRETGGISNIGRFVESVVFLYLTEGVSYRQAAVLLQMTGKYPLKKTRWWNG